MSFTFSRLMGKWRTLSSPCRRDGFNH